MALATQCPHCGTMFRVASDQLKLRGGIVRCGSCQEIFDGSATLVDLDALPGQAPPQAGTGAAAVAAVGPELAPGSAPDSSPDPAPDPASVLPETAPAPVPESESAPAAQAALTVGTAPAPEDEPLAPLEVAVALPSFEDQPVYTLDFDHTFDPFGILPKVDAPQAPQFEAPATHTAPHAVPPVLPPWSQLLKHPEAGPAPGAAPAASAPGTAADQPPEASPAPEAQGAGQVDPGSGLPVDEELVAAALPDHDPEPVLDAPRARLTPPADDAPPLLMRESTPSSSPPPPAAAHVMPAARTSAARRADKAAARRSKLTPTRIEPQPKLRAAEIDEPEFVRRGRQQEQNGRSRKIALLAGSVALLVLLFAQGALTFRNALAARFPVAKPALVSSCAVFGCRVELPAQADNLAIETGELTTLGGGAYSFTTELRNTGATAQAWPSLELALLDADDKPLVRRVFGPADYLAAATAVANGIAPRAAQPIKLHFRVDDLKPSGYHIAVFYP